MSKEKQIEEKEKIISDICPLYKEYGTCKQCNADLDIDDEPCYFECMANAIINNGYRKQIEGEWVDCYPTTTKSHKFVCSACKVIAYYPQPTRTKNAPRACKYNFCPNCGAKMKGGSQ